MTSTTHRDVRLGLVLLLGLVCLLGGIFQEINDYDEGIILVGADRVAHGQVPYRDFWAIYAPGQFYTLAGLFRIFGSSLLVERLWDTLGRLGICLLVLAISRRLVSRPASFVSFLVTLLLLATTYDCFGYPTIPATFWSLLGVLWLLRSFSENQLGWGFLSGLATGISILYRHDLGVYTLLSGTAAVLLSPPRNLGNILKDRTKVIPRHKALLSYWSGTCVAVVPALFSLMRAVPFPDLRADFLEYPRIYSRFRSRPLPTIHLPRFFSVPYLWLQFYIPLSVYLISWVMLARQLWRPGEDVKCRSRRLGWLLLTLLGSCFKMTAVIRPDPIHFMAMTIPASILVPLLLAHWQRENRAAWSQALVSFTLVVLAMLYIAHPILGYGRHLHADASRGGTTSLPRGRPFYVDKDQEDAVRYIQQKVPEGQAIFVGLGQHHRVYSNDALFYFLADRRPGTRYHDFVPGVITTAAVQREVISDMERNQVNYVVLVPYPDIPVWASETPDSGVTLLDDFLRKGYKEVQTFGYYSIWEKGS